MNTINPFVNAIVADAWDQQVTDVPQIHARAFAACRAAFDQIRATGATHSVLLHGEPGSGKTHLLARMRNEFACLGETEPARDPQRPPLPAAVFSSMRLRAGSRMLCRHVRRALARDLLRPDPQRLTQLDWLLIHRAAPHVNRPAQAHRWYRRLRRTGREAEAEAEADELLRRLSRDLQLPGNLAIILRTCALGRNPRAVADWLAEGTLADAQRDALGLLPAPEEADPEEEALDAIEALSRLAGPRLPLVLCFDQVEALQTHPRDVEGPFAFGRMISALHDRMQATLLVTGVQSTFLETMQQAIRQADLDRLGETREALEPLSDELAPLLVARRLDHAPSLAQARRSQADPCWPIGTDAVRHFVRSSETAGCTPRRLIAFCRQRLDAWQSGRETAPPSVEQFLEQQFEDSFQRALETWLPAVSDETLCHGLPLVLIAMGVATNLREGRREGTAAPPRTGDAPAGPFPGEGNESPEGMEDMEDMEDMEVAEADFILRFPHASAAVAVCNEAGNLLTGRLKRLRQFVERHGGCRAGRQLVLLRDSRLPIPPTARKAREHLETLAGHDVPLIFPSAEAVAALEALRGLLSDAKSGDLATYGATIGEDSVRHWLECNLPASVRELVMEIVPPADCVDPRSTPRLRIPGTIPC